MANIKSYSDYNGTATQLHFFDALPNAEFAIRFPGVKGVKYDGYQKQIGRAHGSIDWLPITRKITYKSNPSKHICNSKCLGGKVTGTCECQCGGKNHGSGMFTSLVAA